MAALAHPAGRIGPNAITRVAEVLPTRIGAEAAATLFASAGLLHHLTATTSGQVNSLHGQGVDRLAPGLVVEARAPDGLIEAYRGDGHAFLLAVQWHPEWLFRENPLSIAIFTAFGDAARTYRATRLGLPRTASGIAA